jgi:hypothetical protein
MRALWAGILLVATTLSADIAPEPTLGLSLTPFSAVDVSMTSENVLLRVGKEKTRVEAVFFLRNQGKARSLEIGFPDAIGHYKYEEKGIAQPMLRNFKAWVNTRPVKWRMISAKRDVIRHKAFLEHLSRVYSKFNNTDEKEKNEARIRQEQAANPDWPYLGWLVWKIVMDADETTEIKVSYTVDHTPDFNPILDTRRTHYVLKTGAAWKGPIGKAIIEVVLEEGLTRAHIAGLSPAGHQPGQNGYFWQWGEFEPDQDISFLIKTHPNYSDAASHFLSLYQRQPDKPEWLANAALCEELAHHYEGCIRHSRRLIELEAEFGRRIHHQFMTLYKTVLYYEPWSLYICRSYRKMGLTAQADTACQEAVTDIKALLFHTFIKPQLRIPMFSKSHLQNRLQSCQEEPTQGQ